MLPMVLMENVGESSFLLPLGIPWFYALIAFLVLSFSSKQPLTFSTRPVAEAI
jgi:hypothetical protein